MPTRFFFLACFIFLLGGFSFVFGQEKKITGTIENKIDIEGIHVLNTTSRFNAITNAEGKFFITVKLLDTLVISSVTYVPTELVISPKIYEDGFVSITLEALINELDEVFLGPKLTGNLEQDIKHIKIEKQLNFEDVGIPGFKGVPEEKIPAMIGEVITPFSVNLEGLYKHLSGYYKTLRTKRKWQAQNVTVAKMMNLYGTSFFYESYQIPEDRVYDFLLFCIETSTLQEDFKKENYSRVLTIFSERGNEYVVRLSEEKK
ncbi:MAG: hypothetical protein R2781_11895 [Flavobacteriaceae bacterium]